MDNIKLISKYNKRIGNEIVYLQPFFVEILKFEKIEIDLFNSQVILVNISIRTYVFGLLKKLLIKFLRNKDKWSYMELKEGFEIKGKIAILIENCEKIAQKRNINLNFKKFRLNHGLILTNYLVKTDKDLNYEILMKENLNHYIIKIIFNFLYNNETYIYN